MFSKKEQPELKLGDQILKFLFDNGFPINEYGTYLYKDVIESGVNKLVPTTTMVEISEVEKQMQDPFSQFYFDVARNDNDLGVKTFHDSIQHSYLKINHVNNESNFINNLINYHGDNYMKIAYQLSCYFTSQVIERDLNEQSVRVKKLSK